MTNTEEIKEHRRAIARYWERIPEAWVNLQHYLSTDTVDDPEEGLGVGRKRSADLATRLQGTVAPTNECGAVGCFLGWCWTYKPYQDWCEEQGLVIATKSSMDKYLGLSRFHSYYRGREHSGITQRQEVLRRIVRILQERIYIDGPFDMESSFLQEGL